MKIEKKFNNYLFWYENLNDIWNELTYINCNIKQDNIKYNIRNHKEDYFIITNESQSIKFHRRKRKFDALDIDDNDTRKYYYYFSVDDILALKFIKKVTLPLLRGIKLEDLGI